LRRQGKSTTARGCASKASTSSTASCISLIAASTMTHRSSSEHSSCESTYNWG
jgi:hypothetical protein